MEEDEEEEEEEQRAFAQPTREKESTGFQRKRETQ
jgi:hypothetical protein